MTDYVKPRVNWSKLPEDEVSMVWHVGRIHLKTTIPCKTKEDKKTIIGVMKELELKNTKYAVVHKLLLTDLIEKMKEQEDWKDEWEKETWLAYACQQSWFSIGPANMSILHGVDLDKDSSERYSEIVIKSRS